MGSGSMLALIPQAMGLGSSLARGTVALGSGEEAVEDHLVVPEAMGEEDWLADKADPAGAARM